MTEQKPVNQKSTKSFGHTKILKCNCQHDYQDKHYEENRRVHNVGKKADTCTVCGNKKSNGGS